MRPGDTNTAKALLDGLSQYETSHGPLASLARSNRRNVFVEQVVESIRRVRYARSLINANLSQSRADPHCDAFDPLRAAVLKSRAGDFEEAVWLVFLFVHFGKHQAGGYRWIREIYGRNGDPRLWTWTEVSADPIGFRSWLAANQNRIQNSCRPGGFGNHRKYESLDANSSSGTGTTVESYVEWIRPHSSQQQLIDWAVTEARGEQGTAFHLLYRSMGQVKRFGRTARFDFLTMLEKLDLAPIRPKYAYIAQATGPRRGAKLLFFNNPLAQASSRTLERKVSDLDAMLGVGMQVLEDSICNWQKSPSRLIRFRG